MLVIIDGGEPREVLNDVKIVLGDGRELHVTVTHEGIVTDVVDGGEVIESHCAEHPAYQED